MSPPSPLPPHALDASAVYRAHADFVWRSLQRLGVRPADLEDRFQDVFVVVHRRLHTFRGDAQLTTWLFGICVRIVAAHRRRGWFRREAPAGDLPDVEAASSSDHPETRIATRQSQAVLDRLLDAMDLEKRAVLVMFEIDEVPAEEIAAILSVPVGTVWSRLSAARKQFQKILARHRAARGEGVWTDRSSGETTGPAKHAISSAAPRRLGP